MKRMTFTRQRALARTLLESVIERIGERGRWTQNAYARDRRSRGIDEHDPRACRWCLAGAVNVEARSLRVGHPMSEADFHDVRGLAEGALRLSADGGYSAFNDGHAHGEVLALVRTAIRRLS